MLANILGVIWILLGILWVIKPEMLKNRLGRKMDRKLRRMTFIFVVFFGLMILGSVIKAEGLVPKIIGLIGIIITIKGILLVTSKTSEKLISWWAERSLVFFRIWGIIILTTGVMLILAK